MSVNLSDLLLLDGDKRRSFNTQSRINTEGIISKKMERIVCVRVCWSEEAHC